jgi:dihydrofolate reductase
MYEVMTAYWPTGAENPASTPAMREFAQAWNAMPKVVVSRSFRSADFGFRLARGDLGDVLDGLRADVDGEIQVSGPNLAGQFIERGLVDEFQLVVHPVFLGAGTPYFPRDGRRLDLRQTGVERFSSGVVVLTYERA